VPIKLSLERETGIINGNYNDDVLFLRQLVIDGQWDAALDFVEPMRELDGFDSKGFQYLIARYKYFELLCIKTESGPYQENEFAVEVGNVGLYLCANDLTSGGGRMSQASRERKSLSRRLSSPVRSSHPAQIVGL